MLAFFALVLALSIPFWAMGAGSRAELLPGLQVAALMVVCPGLAAVILTYRKRAGAGVKALLRRSLDYQRIKPRAWFLPIILLLPAVTFASYGIMRVFHLPLPAPQVSIVAALTLLPVFLIAALAEELGWSAYATDPLQARWGALQAALILGFVWAGWHFVPLLEAHRSAGWIAGWTAGTVANRIIIVWLYNRTGHSVFAAALYHAMANFSWQLFPNGGSHYDPRVTGALLAPIAIMVSRSLQPRPARANLAGSKYDRGVLR
jgi:membrane protease YdiL (CAAX protease family)